MEGRESAWMVVMRSVIAPRRERRFIVESGWLLRMGGGGGVEVEMRMGGDLRRFAFGPCWSPLVYRKCTSFIVMNAINRLYRVLCSYRIY